VQPLPERADAVAWPSDDENRARKVTPHTLADKEKCAFRKPEELRGFGRADQRIVMKLAWVELSVVLRSR
jgi:hypothetical protein